MFDKQVKFEERIVFTRLEALVEGRYDIVALIDVNLLQNISKF